MLDITPYLIEPMPVLEGMETYIATAHQVDDETGKIEVLGCVHVSENDLISTDKMFLDAVKKYKFKEDIAYVELTSSTLDYFIEEHVREESVLIPGSHFRYKINDGEKKSSHWQKLDDNFGVVIAKTVLGKANFEYQKQLWHDRKIQLQADFAEAVKSHFGLTGKMFAFLVGSRSFSVDNEASLKALVSHIKAYQEALESD